MRDDIQHGLIVARRHVITREAARFLTAPDADLELFHHGKTKLTGQPVQPMACCTEQEEAVMEQRGADILVVALKRAGVSRIFTLSGNHIMTIFDALIGSGIEIVHTRQEAAAVHMADAWARLTGEVGVAMVTGGQGHTNAIAALPTAMAGEVPVLLLSGHAPLRELGMGTFQELRQADMAEPVTKLSFTASTTAGIGADVARAFRVARSGRPGPVHLSLPTDLMDARITAPALPDAAAFAAEAMPLGATTAQAIAGMIAAAARPIILAPPALCSPRGKPLLAALSAAAGLPVIPMESPRGLNDPSLGAYAGVLAEADLVVLVGKALDFSLRFGRAPGIAPEARFIQIEPDAAVLARAARALPGRIALAAVASASESAEALTHAMKPHANQAWAARLVEALAFRPAAWAALAGASGAPIHPATLFQATKPFLDTAPDAVLISDGGEIGQWAQAILAAPTRIINGLAGAIGPSIPFAMAARAARPEARILAIMGDGTFGFHMAEFDTACRHQLPFVAVVGNDSRWNAEYEIQKRDYGANRTHGCELAPGTRYDLVAVALGGHGEYVTRAEDITPALERAFASGKPACVNVVIEGQPAPNIRMG
jgi:acetolactate synthase-1/2/3 large subunit